MDRGFLSGTQNDLFLPRVIAAPFFDKLGCHELTENDLSVSLSAASSPERGAKRTMM